MPQRFDGTVSPACLCCELGCHTLLIGGAQDGSRSFLEPATPSNYLLDCASLRTSGIGAADPMPSRRAAAWGAGSMAQAARCRLLASCPLYRSSLLRVRLMRGETATGASGNALRPS